MVGLLKSVSPAAKESELPSKSISNPLNLNQANPQVFTSLRTYTNMLRLDTINEAGGDLNIYVDDSNIQWKTGQTLRLTFKSNLKIGSRNIRVWTDSPSRLNNGSYGISMGVIPNADISTKPIIEFRSNFFSSIFILWSK